MDKMYTIGDAAAELGMPASTIRFYEKNGLIPNQQRSSDGRRLFDEDDLEWMRFVERLKVSGMPIKEIREYIRLYIEGDSTIEERRRIVYERRAAIDAQLEELKLARDFIEYKCWFYDVAAEASTCDVPREMQPEDIPEEMRRIKERCGISRY
jgi:DNA-binding transcriptional MerR regulator